MRLCWMALCILTSLWKTQIQRMCAPPYQGIIDAWVTVKERWKRVFKTPAAHEWEAVTHLLGTLVPNSLDSMAQASSDLSVTPLVVQAISASPINTVLYNGHHFEDPRYSELLHSRILPWFVNALNTRRAVFDWVPGRENELQRMACALLLVPIEPVSAPDVVMRWKGFNLAQYCACISRVLQALSSALLDLANTPTVTEIDVATLGMTLLGLGNRLRYLDPESKLVQDDALLGPIATAYSSPSLSVLRLRPIIWYHALGYLRYSGRVIDDNAHFAIALWRTCHAIDSYVKGDNADGDAAFDDNLGFLTGQFVGMLVTTLGYNSIESALRIAGKPALVAIFKSTFLARPALSLAKFLK
ncbi:hypothetical protein EV715DRAFT_268694, partial [Schizophyllum commune]